LRESSNGVVRPKDVGEAVAGPENLRNLMKRNGVPAVGVVLRPQPGANQIEIADEMYRRLELIKKDLPPDIDASVGFDTTRYVRASLLEVRETILLAVALVVLIIFLFLRSWRSTLIPPWSSRCLIGGLFIAASPAQHQRVHLLALVLAIGMVVDDAIVVEHLHEDHKPPAKEAGYGTKEVAIPRRHRHDHHVVRCSRPSCSGRVDGKLFREFAIVLAGTVLISASWR
jgi:multidrug efflux pump